MSDSSQKIFCVSMQRNGTASVGQFFRDFGYQWAGWPANSKNQWSDALMDGNFEKIFSSSDFVHSNAFEDSPWWAPGFFKVLYHRFPDSKFILFTRNPDKWFQSMLSHSRGNILGKTKNHVKLYRRELEYYDLLEAGVIDEEIENQYQTDKTMKLHGFKEHYQAIYRIHNYEVKSFFQKHSPDSLFVGKLEDPDKWQKLGEFLNIQVPPNYHSHENLTTRPALDSCE